MLAIYIILGVLLLLFLPTLLNLYIIFRYDNAPKLALRIAFFTIPLVGEKKPKKKKGKKKEKPKPTAEKKEETEEKQKKKSSQNFKALYKEKGVSGLLDIVKRAASLLTGTLSDLCSKLTVITLKLDLRVAGEDAADSAIKYGRTCAVLFPALSVICDSVEVKDYKVNVNPDFSDNPKNSAKAFVRAKIRIISLLKIAVVRGLQGLRLMMKLKTKKQGNFK